MAPYLAVEVVSPHDLFAEVAIKVSEYLATGVRLVWVVDPATQRVHVYYPDGRGETLTAADVWRAAQAVEDFACRVAGLFAPPAGVVS